MSALDTRQEPSLPPFLLLNVEAFYNFSSLQFVIVQPHVILSANMKIFLSKDRAERDCFR